MKTSCHVQIMKFLNENHFLWFLLHVILKACQNTHPNACIIISLWFIFLNLKTKLWATTIQHCRLKNIGLPVKQYKCKFTLQEHQVQSLMYTQLFQLKFILIWGHSYSQFGNILFITWDSLSCVQTYLSMTIPILCSLRVKIA